MKMKGMEGSLVVVDAEKKRAGQRREILVGGDDKGKGRVISTDHTTLINYGIFILCC